MNLVEMIGKFTMPLSITLCFLVYLVISLQLRVVYFGFYAHALLMTSQLLCGFFDRAYMRILRAYRGSSSEQTPCHTFHRHTVFL